MKLLATTGATGSVTTRTTTLLGAAVGLWTVTNRISLTWAFHTTSTTTFLPVLHQQVKSRKPRCTIHHAAQTGDEYRDNNQEGTNGPPRPRGPPRQPPFPASPSGSPMDPRMAQGAFEANRVRLAYQDWCRNYGKDFQEDRLPIFAENFLRMEKYAEQTGERVKVNEYADLTTDEYRYMLAKKQQGQRYGAPGYGQSPQSLQEPPEWQQAAPTEWQQKIQETNPKGYETLLGLWVYFQTAFVGTVIGTLCVLPVTALHYFALDDFVYTTYAQFEWDLIASAIQGAMFATVYRYGMRRDLDNANLSNRIIAAFVLVKALVRVTVTPDCAAYQPWLYCAEPYYLFNDQMAMQFFINLLESIALFVPVAKVLNSLLEQDKIPPYDGYDA